LVGYCNTDLARDLDTCRSTSNIFFFLNGNPISRQATKQKVVALSSCKAEYIVVVVAACQGI
jgi:hypothetical protein